MRSTAAIALTCVFTSIGCGVQANDEGVTVRDSAGIRIVESSRPRWTARSRWHVADEPHVDLGGGASPAEPYLLQRIIGMMRLDDGRLVIADGQAAELRFYDREGRHLRTVGGQGDGPGEMRVAYDVWRRQGDTLVVSAIGAQLHEFTSTGDFVRSWRPPASASSASGLMSTDFVLGDGSLIVTPPPMFRIVDGTPRRTSELDSTDLFIVAHGRDLDASGGQPDEGVDRAANRGARLFLRHASRPRVDGKVPVFSPSPLRAAAAQHMLFATPGDFEIRWYASSGGLERVYRRAWEPVPVTSAARETWRETNLAAVGGIPEQLQAQRRRQIADAIFASHFAPFDQLLIDRSGSLWVKLARTDGRSGTRDIAAEWSVFDTSGAWLGDVAMPAGIDVQEIGDDYVTAIWLDDLDVQHARVYRLTKP